MLNRLKRYVKLYGAAKAAYVLGYKDTGRIRNWIQRNEIPEHKREDVKRMLNAKVTIDFGE